MRSVMSALQISQGSSKHSAYELRDPHAEVIESHTLAVIVDNEPGVLARVIGLFSGRGYNIESLTVAETDHQGHRSRITIVTTGTPQVIEQIKADLSSVESAVAEAQDLFNKGSFMDSMNKIKSAKAKADGLNSEIKEALTKARIRF